MKRKAETDNLFLSFGSSGNHDIPTPPKEKKQISCKAFGPKLSIPLLCDPRGVFHLKKAHYGGTTPLKNCQDL